MYQTVLKDVREQLYVIITYIHVLIFQHLCNFFNVHYPQVQVGVANFFLRVHACFTTRKQQYVVHSTMTHIQCLVQQHKSIVIAEYLK